MDRIAEQFACRGHIDDLPACVADRLDHNRPLFPHKVLDMGSILIGCRHPVVLLHHAGINRLLFRMIDDLAVPVHQIHIPGVLFICLVKNLLDRAVIHIDKQDSPSGVPHICKLHAPAQGDYPRILVVAALKNVLDMRRGKMQILNLLSCLHKPLLLFQINRLLSRGDRPCCQNRTILRHTDNTDKIVLIFLIQQVHLLVDGLLGQVFIFDDIVIHEIGDVHHITDVAVQVPADLFQHLFVVFQSHLPCVANKLCIERNSHEQHTH